MQSLLFNISIHRSKRPRTHTLCTVPLGPSERLQLDSDQLLRTQRRAAALEALYQSGQIDDRPGADKNMDMGRYDPDGPNLATLFSTDYEQIVLKEACPAGFDQWGTISCDPNDVEKDALAHLKI